MKEGDSIFNFKNSGIFEIPNYHNLGIDKFCNIYIFDDNKNIERKIKYSELKFEYNNSIIYISSLIGLAYYGIENYLDYKNPKILGENTIDINGIIFKKISNINNIDIGDGYYISDSGIIYSMISNKLRKQEIDDDGYHRISFTNKNITHFAIHRLVYNIWVGNIHDGMVIDHKDNYKWNNKYTNLQEVTPKENSRMAAEDGLYNSTFIWTSEKVHDVCKLMQDNIAIKEIAAKYGIYPSDKKKYKNFRNQLSGFRKNNRSWKDIVSQYDLSNYDGLSSIRYKYKDSEILLMRKMYKDGKNIKDIAKYFNTVPSDYFSKLVRGLKRKKINYSINVY